MRLVARVLSAVILLGSTSWALAQAQPQVLPGNAAVPVQSTADADDEDGFDWGWLGLLGLIGLAGLMKRPERTVVHSTTTTHPTDRTRI